MKEQHTFYVPHAVDGRLLPDDEARHAVRTLRMGVGDEMLLTDGEGKMYRAVVEEATPKRCAYRITAEERQQKAWHGHLHLAVAPTKHIDRTEWLVEKAVEIGVDEITFLRGRFSERTTLRMDRMEKIAVAAMKQSRNAFLPVMHDMTTVEQFISRCTDNRHASPAAHHLYIAHCYNDRARQPLRQLLRHAGVADSVTVMIGPEGDFSIDEVEAVAAAGAREVTLADTRLRTETAALVALMTMHIAPDGGDIAP